MTKTAARTFGFLLVMCPALSPMEAQAEAASELLFLEIYVNGRPAEKLLRIERDGARFQTEIDQPNWLPKLIRSDAQGNIDLCSLNSVECFYDIARQRLNLQFPAEFFTIQNFSIGGRNLPPLSRMGSSVLNYDTYYAKFSTNEEFLNITHQLRVSGEYGILESNGNWLKELNHRNPTRELATDYRRYDTFWQYNDEAKMRFYRIGDFVTAPSLIGRQARLGGIQIASDFSLNPSFLSYPYPELSGSSVLPSDIEVFINNNRLFNGSLEPGPFSIATANSLVGLNEATLLTRDILGNVTQRTLQFYFAPELLRKGVSSYALQLGVLRDNFGAESIDYGDAILAVGSYRHGLTDDYTLGTHFEYGDGLKNITTEWEMSLRTRGLLSLGVAYGKYEKQHGLLWQASYRFTNRNWGLLLQHRERDEDYQDIASLTNVARFSSESRINLSFSIPRGQLGVGYFSLKPYAREREELVSGFFSQSFGSLSASLNASYDRNSGNTAVNFYVSVPLGQRGRTSLRQSHSRESSSQTLLNYTSARSLENRVQFGFSTELQRENYSLYGSYRTDSVELSAGATKSLTNDMHWGRAGGSIVFAQNELFIANRIVDGFAIIDTGDFSGVPVRKENQLIGSTNADGQLLVTGLNSYNVSRFAIDSTKLPVNTRIESSSATVATARNMGALIAFPITYSHSALLLLEYKGEHVPMGSSVALNEQSVINYVGWGGELYLEGLEPQNTLTVDIDGAICKVVFGFEITDNEIPVLGPLECVEEK